MTSLSAYTYQQISKYTEKTLKKHYWVGSNCPLPPPPPPPSGYYLQDEADRDRANCRKDKIISPKLPAPVEED